MSQGAHLWLFFVLVLGVVLLPGMDMAYVFASSMLGGRRRGLAAVAGIITGGACHFVIAATGLAVILRVAPMAFNAVLFAGALYMAWIGVSMYRGASAAGPVAAGSAGSLVSTFRRGALTNLLNPKAYLFMLAVFPQFVRAEYGPIARQGFVLWAICALTQAAVYGAVVLAAAHASHRSSTLAGAGPALARAVGAALTVMAIFTVAEGWRRL